MITALLFRANGVATPVASLLLCAIALSPAAASTVSLSWVDNSANETGFKIERGTDGISFAQVGLVGSNATSYNDTTVAAGATYWFRVRAYNSSGDSSFSNLATVTIPAAAPVNTAPTITAIANRTINEDATTGPMAFSVSDPETVAGSLSVSVSSSNAMLVPTSGLVLGGSGSTRTLTVTPAANQSGTATITIVVSDGALTATETFGLSVVAMNDLPTISTIVDRTVTAGSAPGPIAFTVSDIETIAGSLIVTAASSNTLLVPTSNIILGGSGANRTVTVTPAPGQSGTATITLTVSDGVASGYEAFVLTVNATPNAAPTISDLTNLTANEDNSTGPRAFTIGDLETPAGSLTLSASSSNPALVPLTGLVFGGSGSARTLSATPGANQSGTTTITVTVSDGALTASDSFVLTVTAVNDAPSISALADRTIERATVLGPLGFSIADVETAAGSLTVTGVSSNQTLVPNANIVFGGSGGSRTLTVTPVVTQSGTATISVRVSDGATTTTRSFTLTVTFASQVLVSSDIGAPKLAGSMVVTDGGWEIRAGGTDIWGGRDQFHFARQQLLGDAELTVRVGSVTRSHGWAKAGLMFRSSLANNSAHVSVFVTPTCGVVLQWRATTGGNSKSSAALTGAAPEWLRLIRSGDTFYAFRSEDGNDWELVEFITVDLPETTYAGLAVTAHNDKARTTAKFDQFFVD